jgi:hypothetical protein
VRYVRETDTNTHMYTHMHTNAHTHTNTTNALINVVVQHPSSHPTSPTAPRVVGAGAQAMMPQIAAMWQAGSHLGQHSLAVPAASASVSAMGRSQLVHCAGSFRPRSVERCCGVVRAVAAVPPTARAAAAAPAQLPQPRHCLPWLRYRIHSRCQHQAPGLAHRSPRAQRAAGACHATAPP